MNFFIVKISEKGKIMKYFLFLCICFLSVVGIYAETVLYLHGDGNYEDSSSHNHPMTANAVSLSNTVKKVGSGAFAFSGSYLYTPDSSDWTFGSSAFTIDFWVNCSQPGSYFGFLGTGDWYNNTGWSFGVYTTGSLHFAADGTAKGVGTAAGVFTMNQWNHVAVVREGIGTNQTKIYVNGNMAGQGTIGAMNDNNLGLSIGRWGSNWNGGFYYLNGYMDEIRISNTALWTSTFDPSQTVPEPGTFLYVFAFFITLLLKKNFLLFRS